MNNHEDVDPYGEEIWDDVDECIVVTEEFRRYMDMRSQLEIKRRLTIAHWDKLGFI